MVLSQEQRMQMVLAPQLRQSLEMLQLPILELRSLIQQEVERNPTLEEVAIPTTEIGEEQSRGEVEDRKPLDFRQDFQVLAKLDDEWRSYFFQEEATRRYSPDQAEKRQFFLDSVPQRESLQEHLRAQLELAGLSPTDQEIGELIVGSINDDGYLTSSAEELAATAAVDLSRLTDVLAIVQDFNPTGVGARDLKECLLLQLDRLGKADTPAHLIVRDHLEALAAHRIQDVARALKLSAEEVQKAGEFIATLDPKPGRAYSTETPAYVLPEVLVQKVDGQYVVILNDDNLPHVRISNHYRHLMEDPATSDDVRNYVTDRVKSGVFLIKSIQQRQQTLFRIATEIVRTQTEFLDHGLTRMRPLTMAQIASVVGVHETTVSRAVSGKYMQTPTGVFEMKYFFAPGFRTEGGEDISNKTVQDMIARLVADEDPDHPLSDQDIVAQLDGRGVHVARRTVAKYRLVLRIPPSHMRKSF